METNTAKEVVSFMEAYNELYKEYLVFLNNKMSKVLADDLLWLSESLGSEQAIIMKCQSFEQKRLDLFKSLGLRDYTVTMLVEEAPDEIKSKLKLECKSFNDYINQVQKLNEDIVETVEKKLKYQADLVKKIGMVPQDTYDGHGTKLRKTTGGGIIGSV